MQEKSRPRGRTGLPSPKTVHHNNPIPPEPSHRPDGTLQHQWSRKYKAPKTSLQETTPGRPIENENIAKLGPRIVRSNLENPISIIKGNGNKVPLQIPGGICVGRGGRKMCYRALPGLAKIYETLPAQKWVVLRTSISGPRKYYFVVQKIVYSFLRDCKSYA